MLGLGDDLEFTAIRFQLIDPEHFNIYLSMCGLLFEIEGTVTITK